MLAGIGSLLGGAIHSLASGRSMVIKTIGEGIRDIFHGVGDLDEKVVGSISNATSTVISAGASWNITNTGFCRWTIWHSLIHPGLWLVRIHNIFQLQ